MSDEWNLIVSVFALPTVRDRRSLECKDTNSQQTVFGGWLLSHQDLACLSQCKLHEPGKYLTVGIKELVFISTVDIGDLVRVYTRVKHVGKTSIQIEQKTTKNTLQTASCSLNKDPEIIVSTGIYIFVKVDGGNNKQEIIRQIHASET